MSAALAEEDEAGLTQAALDGLMVEGAPSMDPREDNQWGTRVSVNVH